MYLINYNIIVVDFFFPPFAVNTFLSRHFIIVIFHFYRWAAPSTTNATVVRHRLAVEWIAAAAFILGIYYAATDGRLSHRWNETISSITYLYGFIICVCVYNWHIFRTCTYNIIYVNIWVMNRVSQYYYYYYYVCLVYLFPFPQLNERDAQ